MNKLEYLLYVLKNFRVHWTFLPADLRYLGYKTDWYDGPIFCFGLWWGHFYYVDKYMTE